MITKHPEQPSEPGINIEFEYEFELDALSICVYNERAYVNGAIALVYIDDFGPSVLYHFIAKLIERVDPKHHLWSVN